MSYNEPVLINTGRGATVKYKQRYLYSSVDPINSIVKRIKKIRISENTLIFIPSLGLGYGFAELLACIPVSSHILCVEADQALMGMALKQAVYSIPKASNLTVVRSDSPQQIARLVRDMGIWRFRRLKALHLCGGYYLNRDVYKEMERLLDDEIHTYWQNKITLIHMGRLWVKNIITNIQFFTRSRSIDDLKIKYPVLVIGAGASLEQSLFWIKSLRNKVLILVVDTALPVLLGSGIKPDFIFMLEAQTSNMQDFISYPFTFPSIPLICDITSDSSIIRLFKGNTFFFSSLFYPLKLIKHMEEANFIPTSFPPMGSVGVAAVHAALMITAGPVIIAGLDFSYTYNKTHARGAPALTRALFSSNRLKPAEHLNYSAIQSRPLLKLKGKQKKIVLSDMVLSSYAGRLTEIVHMSKRIYDIGQQGLDTGARAINSLSELSDILTKRVKPHNINKPGVNISGANVSGVNISGANVSGASLCRNMFTEQVNSFLSMEKHKLEAGIALLKKLISRHKVFKNDVCKFTKAEEEQ